MKRLLFYFLLVLPVCAFSQQSNSTSKKTNMENKYVREFLNELHQSGKIKNPQRMYDIVMKAATPEGIVLKPEEVDADVIYLDDEADIIFWPHGSNALGFTYKVNWNGRDLVDGKKR